MEYSQVFDVVMFEKEKAIARFNLFRRIANSRQIIEALVVLGLISWSTARVPAVAKTAVGHVVRFSTYLFNHHVVFLIGNVIIVLLFVLFRRNDAVHPSGAGTGDLCDDYVKHSEAAHGGDPTPPPTPETACGPPAEGGGDEEKQIVVCADETVGIPQCDDVAAAIEKAARQIKRFQRTQSETLRRDLGARPQAELRRSESQNRRKSVSSGEQFRPADMERLRREIGARPQADLRRKSVSSSEQFGAADMERLRREIGGRPQAEPRRRSVSSGEQFSAADMERLTSEEFRRTVDAFIDKHWISK